MEGDGAVYTPGSRALHPLTVAITDETGRPVEGAAVSFHLPDEGPGGQFVSGLRTEVDTTDARGRAALRLFQVNKTPGRFQIRIIAAKEQARAGTVAFQYVAGTDAGGASVRSAGNAPASGPNASSHSHAKWIGVIAAVAAGGALAGVLAGRGGSASSATPAPPSPPALTIGAPSTSVGKP